MMHNMFNAITSPKIFCHFENNNGWPRDGSSYSIHPLYFHPPCLTTSSKACWRVFIHSQRRGGGILEELAKFTP